MKVHILQLHNPERSYLDMIVYEKREDALEQAMQHIRKHLVRCETCSRGNLNYIFNKALDKSTYEEALKEYEEWNEGNTGKNEDLYYSICVIEKEVLSLIG